MNTVTKERHLQILSAAKSALNEAGGIDWYDRLLQRDAVIAVRKMTAIVAKNVNCHPSTAKRNLYKAIRLARGEHVGQWGGPRQPGGGS